MSVVGDLKAGDGRKLPKPNNMMLINTSLGIEFFRWWCTFNRSLVKITDRELEVLANLLNERWKLSKQITDPVMLDTTVMSKAVKEKIQKACNISDSNYNVVLNNLRKHHIVEGKSINPKLIPNVDDKGIFQLLILMKY